MYLTPKQVFMEPTPSQLNNQSKIGIIFKMTTVTSLLQIKNFVLFCFILFLLLTKLKYQDVKNAVNTLYNLEKV